MNKLSRSFGVNKPIIVGGSIYCECLDCGKLVRVNKPILGSLHFCLSDEEMASRRSDQCVTDKPAADVND
jgi:hypothetical protein